jgi:predicted MFS family arabinose efflux permease
MLGVTIGLWLGLRAVFGAAALLYLAAALLALRALPRSATCTPPR